MENREEVKNANRSRRQIRLKKTVQFWRLFGIFSFALVLAVGFVIGTLWFFRPSVSNYEKRTLSRFPELTWEGFWDGSYTSAISLWYADTFPGRDALLEAGQTLKTAYGIKGNYIAQIGGDDDSDDLDDLLSSLEDASDSSSEDSTRGDEPSSSEEPDVNPDDIKNPQNAGAVNLYNHAGYAVSGFLVNCANRYATYTANVANALQGISDVYQILIPDNSAIMLPEEIRTEWKLPPAEKVIAYYNKKAQSLSPFIRPVSICQTLRDHNDEYLYFRTDHHWTQLGAYYAYRTFCEAAGLTPHELSDYQQIVMEGFTGTYVTVSGYSELEAYPDTITAYVPIGTNTLRYSERDMETFKTSQIVRDLRSQTQYRHGWYTCYICGDNALSIIENPTVHNGKKAILVKESFGNAFAPFLVDHYETVYVVDYRYYTRSIVTLAKENQVTDVIFMNNTEAIAASSVMDQLSRCCGIEE